MLCMTASLFRRRACGQRRRNGCPKRLQTNVVSVRFPAPFLVREARRLNRVSNGARRALARLVCPLRLRRRGGAVTPSSYSWHVQRLHTYIHTAERRTCSHNCSRCMSAPGLLSCLRSRLPSRLPAHAHRLARSPESSRCHSVAALPARGRCGASLSSPPRRRRPLRSMRRLRVLAFPAPSQAAASRLLCRRGAGERRRGPTPAPGGCYAVRA
jgi:hypothetical protein